ncbi:hypothetical protein BLS_007441 [Venturia inaequalis]|uniref:MINDY deubiquitinase domain-containing protein n=1 Tax=Venturia inaequalis TaxID=5025 RepID=A0A8H3V399_VENIN|nr:hypothetical protein BLS_007441 [Venturia inaequalis]KAE9979549.1 hypothetical protein EG328_000802 [Venturia inaequalis]RDI82427.1 hypothetical protein Vi05172_g7334 [Venturia inaequalis]
MVTRKPLPGPTTSDLPPYPSSPTTTTNPTSTPPKVELPQLPNARVESEDEDDDWDKEDSDSEWELEGGNTKPTDKPSGTMALPAPSSRQTEKRSDLPESLRVGPPGGAPAKSKESLVSDMSNTSGNNNPWRTDASRSPPKVQQQPSYLRPQTTGEALFGPESGSSHWSGTPPLPTSHLQDSPPTELPTHHVTTGGFSKLTLGEDIVSSPFSTQPPLIPVESTSPFSSQPPLIPVVAENGKQAIHPDRENSVASTTWDPQTDLSSLDAFSSRAHGLPDNALIGSQRTWQEQQAFEKSERERREREAGIAFERAQKAEEERRAEEEWHAGEQAAAAGFPQTSSTGLTQPASPEGLPPTKPPRPLVDTSVAQDEQRRVDSPNTAMKKQRNQTYQIKKVRWFDANAGKVRVTPVLVQNANGPCPLLALVNALTLSTPMDIETGLVETLRTREQVSLGLLLDAVFEELMSGRRGEGAHDLPDVSDLYSFLITLHTGMNVNPRFTFNPDRSSMTMNAALQSESQPGGFEDTREMKLYSTFSIPLMHGWLPTRDEPAYAAFDRSAKTYEETQNIQFYEEELEAKLSSTGLNSEEQHLFEDLATIKHFMSEWPTQLTEYGLNVLLEHIEPGQFAILFRNDHFSTVYKEPRSQQLLILVTDAGYSSHEEIVWESLVDISGSGTVHYSGDFRPVSHTSPSEAGPAGPRGSSLSGQPVQSMLDVDQGWTTVQGKGKARGNQGASPNQQSGIVGSSSSTAQNDAPLSSEERTRAEQEDHDLALALQLQDEEEERHRAEQAGRRREQDLRGQVMDPQQRPLPAAPQQPIRPTIPPRRNNVPTTNRPTNPDEESPPTYEQASKDRRFVPPRDHPASPHAPVSPALQQRQSSAYMQNSTSLLPGRRQPGPLGGGLGRGQSRPSGINQAGMGIAQEKCTIM